jgi:hypothetical protein
MEHLTELIALHKTKYSFSINGGIGFRQDRYALGYDPAYFSLNAGSQVKLGKILRVQAEVSLRGWSKMEALQWLIHATFPFLK